MSQMGSQITKWKHFPRYWPFVRRIHRSTVNSSHKGQWRGALMFSLIYAWIKGWVNNGEAGDLRRRHVRYDAIVMQFQRTARHHQPTSMEGKTSSLSEHLRPSPQWLGILYVADRLRYRDEHALFPWAEMVQKHSPSVCRAAANASIHLWISNCAISVSM